MTDPKPSQNENQATPGAGQAGLPAVRCSECGHIAVIAQLKAITRPLEGQPGVYDVGFNCPSCIHFFHAAYTNDDLMRRQREINLLRHPSERAKAIRGYKRKFDAFQAEIEAKVKASQPAPPADEGSAG